MRNKILQSVLDETPKESYIFTRIYADLVLRINEILNEKKLTQKALADRMDKSPSEISKWLSGDHNLTLRSIAKLQAELDEVLILVAPRKDLKEEFKGRVSFEYKKNVQANQEVQNIHKLDWRNSSKTEVYAK